MPAVPNLSIRVMTGPEDVHTFWEWLTQPGRPFFALDVESTGLDVYEPGFKVRLFQIGDTKGGWAIPFQGWRTLIQAIFDWCSRARMEMNWWNFNYDSGACEEEGIEIDYTIQTDSYVLAGLGGYADQTRELKPCAMRELGQWAGVGQATLKKGMHDQGWDWANVPIGWKPYPLYGVLDVCLTALLREKWQHRMDRWRHMHDLEIETIRLCNRMVKKGLAVDRDYLRQSADKYLTRELDIEAKLAAAYGVTPGQNDRIAEILKSQGAFPKDSPLTAGGKPSVAAAVLKQMPNNRLARAVLMWRSVHKTRTSYLESLLDFGYGSNLVHCNIQPMQAKTGRMSISKPALQQLPGSVDDPVDNVVVRHGVIANVPGDELMLSLDFSQIELRLWASMFDDVALIQAIKEADASGLDFFTSLCRTIYAEPDFQKKDPRRTRIKSSTYAKLFDGGIEIAAATAGVEVVTMIPTWHILGQKFPSLFDAGKSHIQYEAGAGAGFLMSPYDRRFTVSTEKEVRKLPNYLCQGTAAIALKKAICGIAAAGMADYLVLPVHDEVLSSVPAGQAKEIRAEMKEVMDSIVTEDNGWAINVPADGGFGPTWQEAKAA